MNIYVGNIAYSMSEEDLKDEFEKFGEVSVVKIITDRDTGRSKGYGFVEMDDDGAAQEAIASLNGTEMQGRELRVNEARPREDRPRRDFRR